MHDRSYNNVYVVRSGIRLALSAIYSTSKVLLFHDDQVICEVPTDTKIMMIVLDKRLIFSTNFRASRNLRSWCSSRPIIMNAFRLAMNVFVDILTRAFVRVPWQGLNLSLLSMVHV